MNIHPTAVVDPEAQLDSSVSVGPYTVIEKGVAIGADCEIGAHVVLAGQTTIGSLNKISHFSTVGTPPQDLKYAGEPTRVEIGNNNLIREYVSINRGTEGGHGVTRIGNNNMIMSYSHIAHDCIVGNHVIMANCATLGGHVEIGDHANLSGMVGIHQFTRVGAYTYIGGMSGISKDIPPFVIASGMRNKLRITGINTIGLKRCGYDQDTIAQVRKAFVYIFRTPELVLADALEKCENEFADCKPVNDLVAFFRAKNRMGVLKLVNGTDDE